MSDVRRPLLPAWSFYGTGIAVLGYERQGDSTYLVTRWITVLFFPLIPLSCWIILPVRSDLLAVGTLVGETHRFTIVRRAPLTTVTVLRTYGYAIALTLVAVLPAAVLFGAGIIQALRKAHDVIGFVVFLLAVGWPVVVLGWLNNRINNIYDDAAGAGSMPNNQMQRTRPGQSAPRR